jgi:hypothetical protein
MTTLGECNPDQFIKMTKEIKNYIGRTYTKYTADFIDAVEQLQLTDPTPPVNPDPTNAIAFKTWMLDIKEHRSKMQEYENFRVGLYSVVLSQYTEALEDRLKSHHELLAADRDGIALPNIVKTIM